MDALISRFEVKISQRWSQLVDLIQGQLLSFHGDRISHSGLRNQQCNRAQSESQQPISSGDDQDLDDGIEHSGSSPDLCSSQYMRLHLRDPFIFIHLWGTTPYSSSLYRTFASRIFIQRPQSIASFISDLISFSRRAEIIAAGIWMGRILASARSSPSNRSSSKNGSIWISAPR